MTAILAAVSRLRRSGGDRNRVITDFLNGGVLFPFLVMMAIPFSSHVLKSLEESSKATFFFAGGVGAFWVIAELRKP